MRRLRACLATWHGERATYGRSEKVRDALQPARGASELAMKELKELMLQKPRWTLAIAESLTVGHIQARIGAISGASDFFLGGVTAYSLEQKVTLLGVDRAEAERVNCVSVEIAEQMACGVCRLFGADVGVATTGYAEPVVVASGGAGGSSKGQGIAAPFAWWAVAVRVDAGRPAKRTSARPGFKLWHGRVECPSATRVQAQAIVADAAIAELTASLRAFGRSVAKRKISASRNET